METEMIKPRSNRLFRKTYMYFAVIVCVFAVLLGIVSQKRAETIHVDYSMEVLGSALGVKKVAVVAVTDDGFAELLKKKMKNN